MCIIDFTELLIQSRTRTQMRMKDTVLRHGNRHCHAQTWTDTETNTDTDTDTDTDTETDTNTDTDTETDTNKDIVEKSANISIKQ